MKIAVACGGTGGHIFPGLATAQELQSRGHDVTLWLAGRDVESDSISGWNGRTVMLQSAGFPTEISLRSIGIALVLLKAVMVAYYRMKSARPDVVLAMGSYASVAPVLAARSLHIPVVLHEANAVPGRAVALLSRVADAVGITFKEASVYLKSEKVSVVGLPLRGDLSQVQHVPCDQFRLLVMGGSQGAHAINECMPEAAKLIIKTGRSLQITHLAGQRDAAAVAEHYARIGVEANVHAFVTDMATVYANTDFAVARAGAATCAELAVCSIPALLVPLPTAVRDHQLLNAEAMSVGGGMRVLRQEFLTPEWCRDFLTSLMDDPGTLSAMSNHLRGIMPDDGAARLADLVEKEASK